MYSLQNNIGGIIYTRPRDMCSTSGRTPYTPGTYYYYFVYRLRTHALFFGPLVISYRLITITTTIKGRLLYSTSYVVGERTELITNNIPFQYYNIYNK